MIFGKTYVHRDPTKDCWKPCFAWLPIKLVDGRRAWLQRVEVIDVLTALRHDSTIMEQNRYDVMRGVAARLPNEAS